MSLREFLLEIEFEVTYNGDNIVTTCKACGEQAAYTLHTSEPTIMQECQDHAEQCLGI